MGESEITLLSKQITNAMREQEFDRERRAKSDQDRRHADMMEFLARMDERLKNLEGLPKRVGKLEQAHSAIAAKVTALAAGAGAVVSWFMGRSN